MFLLFISLILSLILVLKLSFSIHILVSFSICFCSWVYWNSVINFLLLVNLVYPFLIHNEMNASQFRPKGYNYLNLPSWLYKLMLTSVVSLSAHSYVFFCFCFYPWPYIRNVTLLSKNFVNIFSIAVHVFRILFRKLCSLFGQILTMCLKCSRASFLFSLIIAKRCAGNEVSLKRVFLGKSRDTPLCFSEPRFGFPTLVGRTPQHKQLL